jgi:predicted nucleotidyltransferase
MRLHGVLADVLGSPARVKVARALVRVTAGRWTGREVARAAGCSAPQAVHALRQLEELGFVSRRAVGRAHEWTLVEDHVLVGPLRILFEFEADLPNGFRRDLRNELRGLPLRSAVLFGSMARGSETNASDADLYLEPARSSDGDALQAALTPIVGRMIRRYGTVISPLICTRPGSTKTAKPGLLKSIREEGVPILPAET